MSTEDNKTVELEAKIAELEKENKDLKKALDESNDNLDNSLNHIKEISEKLSFHESAPEGGVIVKVGKKSYKIIGKKFIVGGKEMTVEDLVKDKEYLAKMVKGGSGILEEVGAEKGEES